MNTELTPDLARRFGGLERLYGTPGAQAIRKAHVAVIGIGGVGSWTAEALARSGVGHLTLVDLDHVSESNINRQIHALDSTLGQAKVLAMKARIAQINPECVVTCVEEFVEPGNWPALLPDGADAIIDACDDVKAKVAMAAWATEDRSRRRQLFITVGAAGGKRQAHKVDIDDLSATTHDPLLATVRSRLRRDHGAPRDGKRMGLACVFSREAVAHPDAAGKADKSEGAEENTVEGTVVGESDGSLNCHGYGSVVSVTATFGQCAAGWVLDKLASRATL